MIPTRIFFQIHDSRRLLMTYSFNDFLSGYLSLVLYSFFWCPNVCFHTQNYVDFSTTVFLYHLSFCSDMDLFVTQRMHEGHTPLGKNLEIELSKRHILHSLDRTQLIHIRVFCRAFLRVSLFMVPKPKYKDL